MPRSSWSLLQTFGQVGHAEAAVAVPVEFHEQDLKSLPLADLRQGEQRQLAFPGQGPVRLGTNIAQQ